MSRRGVVAAGALVIAAIALAGWWFARDRPATGAAASAPARDLPAGEVSREGAAVASTTPVTDPDDPSPAIDATHAAVHAIGRGCWAARTPLVTAPGEPDDTVGRMELRLRVEIAAGQARVADAEVVSTRRLTDELRDCIVAGVTAATWPTAAPDQAVTIVELFRMGDYLGPDRSRPPPRPLPPAPR